jgi:hypothetical protein
MKTFMTFIALALFPVLVQAAQVNPASQKAALATVQAIVQINFPNQLVQEKVTASTVTGDETNTIETFTIDAYTTDSEDDQISSDFTYTIELLDGIIWSVQTSCKTCG